MPTIYEQLKEIAELAKIPMKSEQETKRVEIIMLKYKESPEIIDEAIQRIIHLTDYPFKLTVYDNRPNSANTSRIWNKLVADSTCDYVLIIDSDAYVPNTEPCWLTKMMESIDETGIVIPVSDAPGGSQQRVNAPEVGTVLNKGAWSGYCFLFKKSVWEKNKFDERFYIYGQDSEWAIRTGGAIMRKDVLVKHLGGASFNSDPLRNADKTYARALFQKLCTRK